MADEKVITVLTEADEAGLIVVMMVTCSDARTYRLDPGQARRLAAELVIQRRE